MAAVENPEDGGTGLSLSSMVKEIQGLKDKFKREDMDSPSPFADLEKATVMQECRVFSDSKIVTESPRKCSQLITKLLHIVTQGDTMSSSEVTDVFFGVTKLFQSSDASLRRMVYFFIKEVAETCNPDDIIIATSSLTKDMNSNEDLFRANSIRVLAKMMDTTMLGAIERYVKQAIVDKNAIVSSSALVAGAHLIKGSPDVVRRWVNEVQEALHSTSEMVQFHALSLLYEIKRHDRLAVSKMVAQMTRGIIVSSMATCLLIRYITAMVRRVGQETLCNATGRITYQFLELSLRHRSEAVIYEAAKALCTLPGVEERDVGPAIAVLQLFLSSPKSTLRLAAMRALSSVAVAKPSAVTKCNDDMEALIGDDNRSIATLAITTLLKTGSESSVDRLMKQISGFMNEIGDEFKIVVVTAIRELCLKYPLKHRVLVGFLANFLREEGGFDFKKSIVDAVVALVRALPETKESSLFHLCEFIEDCEFTALSTQILHLVGSLGPTTAAPARYIRFVYNRVILENASVRSAAITALSKFAAHLPMLRTSVSVLLTRSLRDEDDEVRDRATVALRLLGLDIRNAFNLVCDASCEPLGPESLRENPTIRKSRILRSTEPDDIRLLIEWLPLSFSKLSRALEEIPISNYLVDNVALSFTTLPIVEEKPASHLSQATEIRPTLDAQTDDFYKVPALVKLGNVIKSAPPVQLTESETEYVVACTKHVLHEHVVLQFAVTNTVPDQLLVDISVSLESADTSATYKVVSCISIPNLHCGASASSWVILRRCADTSQGVAAQFMAEMRFHVVEVDPATGEVEGDEHGFAEEYPLEDIEICTADFMVQAHLEDFKTTWDALHKSGEVLQKFALHFRDVQSALAAIISCLGMQRVPVSSLMCFEPLKTFVLPAFLSLHAVSCRPIDGTDTLDESGPVLLHTLHLSGVFVGDIVVLVRAQIRIDDNLGCILKLAARSSVKEVSQLVADCIK